MKAHSKTQQLKTLVSYQWGLFSSAQAEEINIQCSEITRLAKKSSIKRIRRGIYTFDDSGSDSNIGIKAAWMSLYPKQTASERLSNLDYDAIVIGKTAAALHRIGDFYSSPFSFAVKKRRQTRQNDIICRIWEIDPSDIIIVDSLPVTSPERTIADLIRLNEDPSLIGNALNDAIKLENRFDYDRFVELLSPLASRNGFEKDDGKSFAGSLFSQYLSSGMEKQFFSIANDVVRFNITNISELFHDAAQNALSNVYSTNEYDDIKQIISNMAELSVGLTSSLDLTSTIKAMQELSSIAEESERKADEIQNAL